MGSLERRIRELEEQFSRPALGEATGEPRPPIFGRYDAAVEVFRAALQRAKAPGVSRVPETPELSAAKAEMIQVRNSLRAFSRERGKSIGSERKDGDS